MNIILADNQELTRLALGKILSNLTAEPVLFAGNKPHLIEKLLSGRIDAVILDYTLFDLSSINELFILCDRFPDSNWLLISESFAPSFINMVGNSKRKINMCLKTEPLAVIEEAVEHTLAEKRYLSEEIMLSINSSGKEERDYKLTATEKEILRHIALGKTTKEIAAEKFLSFHTVNSHRKNIFRKLEINNMHEAVKYALRYGLIDMSDYSI